jgi:predicted N-acetyltransferase YhbS
MTLRIDIIPELDLTAQLESDIATLLARCFDTDFGGRSFFQQRHHLRLLARDPGLVGHIALTFRAIRIGGVLTDIAGLAEVATDPARRGQGIAATLLQVAMDEAKTSLARHLLLFGNARIYAAAGFTPARNPMTWIDLSGARTGGLLSQRAEQLMVLSLQNDRWDPEAPLDLLGMLF